MFGSTPSLNSLVLFWIHGGTGPTGSQRILRDPIGSIGHVGQWDPTGSSVNVGQMVLLDCCGLLLSCPKDPAGSPWIRSERGLKNLFGLSRPAAALVDPKHPLVYGPIGSQRILLDPVGSIAHVGRMVLLDCHVLSGPEDPVGPRGTPLDP